MINMEINNNEIIDNNKEILKNIQLKEGLSLYMFLVLFKEETDIYKDTYNCLLNENLTLENNNRTLRDLIFLLSKQNREMKTELNRLLNITEDLTLLNKFDKGCFIEINTNLKDNL